MNPEAKNKPNTKAVAKHKGNAVAYKNGGSQIMEVNIAVIIAVSVVLWILSGVAMYLRNEMAIIWSVYFAIVLTLLVPALTWQKRVFDRARHPSDSPNGIESALRAGNRAWISVDLQLNGPVTFDWRGATVRFLLKTNNTGNSPALKVNTYLKIINQQNPNIIGEQREVCGLLEEGTNRPGSGNVPWGNTLFPGPDHDQIQPYVLTVIPEELGRSKDFDGYFKGKIMLHILGCVDYSIDESRERHQSFFSYSVMRIAAGKNEFIEMGHDVALTDLFVFKDTGGWGAN